MYQCSPFSLAAGSVRPVVDVGDTATSVAVGAAVVMVVSVGAIEEVSAVAVVVSMGALAGVVVVEVITVVIVKFQWQ